MRILLLTHHYAPEVGPPQLRWSALTRDIVAAGHRVDVIAPHPHYPQGTEFPDYMPPVSPDTPEVGPHGESIYRVDFRPSRGNLGSVLGDQVMVAANSIRALIRLRRSLAPDVVIATTPALPTLLAGCAAKCLLRKPLVVEVRDAWPDLFAVSGHWDASIAQPRLRKRLALRAAPPVVSWLQRRGDRVVTTTETFAVVLRERGAPQVAVVRNTPHPIEASVPAAPQRRPRTAGSLNVIYAGTVGRAQGLHTAVDAVRLAREAGADVRLKVIGSGVEFTRLAEYAKPLSLPIEILERVPRERLRHEYAWADTALVMLRDWEPLEWTVPSKLYAAMAIGMHVSGSVSGEAAGIIAASGCGFAVPPEDAQALANAWIELAQGSQDPCQTIDHDRTAQWLEGNATEAHAAATYLEILDGVTLGSRRRVATLSSTKRAG